MVLFWNTRLLTEHNELMTRGSIQTKDSHIRTSEILYYKKPKPCQSWEKRKWNGDPSMPNFPSLQLLPPTPHSFNYTPRSLLLPIHFQSHSMLTPSISFDRSLTQIQWPCHLIPHVFLDSSSACISRITTLKMFQALTENSLLGTGRYWVDRGLNSQSDGWEDKIRKVGSWRSIHPDSNFRLRLVDSFGIYRSFTDQLVKEWISRLPKSCMLQSDSSDTLM